MTLKESHCLPADSTTEIEDQASIIHFKSQIDDEWHLSSSGHAIERIIRFNNYYETMAFANAVAWIAHMEDHHPEMVIAYNRCQITYSTHSAGGLTRSDFICAAKIDALLD